MTWYSKEGLRFQCTGCGRCCTGSPGYVWVTESEMESMAHFLNLSLLDFKKRYIRRRDHRYALIEKKNINSEYDCIFLKDKQCSIYSVRPTQCRTFPWWRENLHSPEDWQSASLYCEGINDQASLISPKIIEEELAKNSD